MPSPIGHSVIGLALGAGYALPRTPWRNLGSALYRVRWLLALALFLANAPDLDYVPGLLLGDFNAYHHGYTHTLAWVVMLAAGGYLLWRAAKPDLGWPLLGFVLLVLLSHLVADIATEDRRLPYGIMFFWPLSEEHFISPVSVFPRWHKDTLAAVFQWQNLRPALVELAWTAPLVVGVLLYKCGPATAVQNRRASRSGAAA